jgi:hypothetical protein
MIQHHDVFSNQDNRLWELQDRIKKLEEEMEVRDLTKTERSKLYCMQL